MAGCDPRPRRRALGPGVVLAAAIGGALGGAIVAPPIGHAQPAQPAPAQDLERAKELYRSGEAAMQDGRFEDAARDYGASYELSQDPALFYKIGRASERAGKCDIALIYYARYLREGKPSEQFTALTHERIAACGGAPVDAGTSAGSAAEGAGSGSAASGAGPAIRGSTAPTAGEAASSGSSATGAAPGAPGEQAGSAAGAAPPASPTGVARASDATATPPPGPAASGLIPPTREKVAWLLGGGAIALVTLGGVLAYAASSSENDVRDLYAGLAGQVPTYDGATRKRYADLVDQGERYQHLSWAAFGLAGAAAVGVVVLFTTGRDEQPARAATVTPVVGPRSAGVSVRF